jgi:hypothetical protein
MNNIVESGLGLYQLTRKDCQRCDGNAGLMWVLPDMDSEALCQTCFFKAMEDRGIEIEVRINE